MGITYELDTTAEAFHCGLLAAQVSAILEREQGYELTKPDRDVVNTAINCIQELVGAVQTLAYGHSALPTSPNSFKVLGFALPSLQKLTEVSKAGAPSEEIAIGALRTMEKALCSLIKEGKLPKRTTELDATRMFFGSMSDYQLSSLNRARMGRPNIWGF